MPTDHYPDFSGKHIHVYLKEKPGRSYLIQDVTFEIQAGRVFLVGRVSEAYGADVWCAGHRVCMAWDCVDQYVIFDSAEQWRTKMDAWKLQNPKPQNNPDPAP